MKPNSEHSRSWTRFLACQSISSPDIKWRKRFPTSSSDGSSSDEMPSWSLFTRSSQRWGELVSTESNGLLLLFIFLPQCTVAWMSYGLIDVFLGNKSIDISQFVSFRLACYERWIFCTQLCTEDSYHSPLQYCIHTSKAESVYSWFGKPCLLRFSTCWRGPFLVHGNYKSSLSYFCVYLRRTSVPVTTL